MLLMPTVFSFAAHALFERSLGQKCSFEQHARACTLCTHAQGRIPPLVPNPNKSPVIYTLSAVAGFLANMVLNTTCVNKFSKSAPGVRVLLATAEHGEPKTSSNLKNRMVSNLAPNCCFCNPSPGQGNSKGCRSDDIQGWIAKCDGELPECAPRRARKQRGGGRGSEDDAARTTPTYPAARPPP